MKALLQRIRQILRDRRTRRFFKRFVGTFAAIVVFVTTYALVLPAITMEAEAQCGIEAHQHDDSCYEEVLVCDIPENNGHHHDESCYSVSLQLICRTDEHQHDADCYDENGELTCEKAEHIHSEENGCYKEVRELVCGQEESTGHQHNEGCYEKVLACGKEAHTHSQACYHSDASGNTAESAAVSSTESAAVVVSSTSASSTTSASSSASTTTTAPAAVAASTSASTDETASSASAASTVSENSPEDAYVPVLDPVDFNRILTGDTGIYYYHPEDNENIPENSGDITGWMPLDKETILDPSDIIRVYLAYSIPSGSLNSTNPVARYRLPSNLHLSDSQVESINSTVNGIANQYADMDTLEITDPAKYSQSLGVEAIEGTRKPSDDIAKYFDKHKKMDGQEFISATVKVEDIYDTDDTDAANAGFDTNDPGGADGEDAAPDAESSNSEYIRNNTVNNENSTYSGTDLVFTFTPYSIQKNQHTYDSTGKPVSAGQEIRGWMTFDLRTDQIDFEAASTDTGKEAAIVFVPETRDPQSGLDIDEISQILHLQETVAETGIASDDKAEKPALLYPARTFQDSITASMGTLSTDTETGLSTALPEETELTVYVEADEGTFPEGTTMKVSTVEDMDSVASAVEEAVTADDAVSNKTRGFHAVDISFRNAEGIEIEPLRPIRVSIKSESIKQAVEDSSTAPVVVHVTDPALEQAHAADQDSTLDQVPASDQAPADPADEDIDTTDEDGSYNSGKVNDTSKPVTAEDSETEEGTGGNRDNGAPVATIVETGKPVSAENNGTIDTDTLTFETGSFSVYAIVYTVDFHWEVDGKTFEFSIPGGGFISFEHLVEVLGIGEGGTNAGTDDANVSEITENYADEAIRLNEAEVSEATRQFAAGVEKVEFASPELVWVGKVYEESTVGVLKETNGLEIEYSAELTEEQIAEINAQTLEAGDWALISLQPFDTVETLTITMDNGEQFVIRVTDASYSASKTLNLDGKTVALVNLRNNNALQSTAHSTAGRLNAAAITYNSSTNRVQTTNASETLTHWTFEKVNGSNNQYYISAPNGYLNINGSSLTVTGTRQALQVEQKSDGTIRIRTNNNYAVNNNADQTANGYGAYQNGGNNNRGEWFTAFQLDTIALSPMNENGILAGNPDSGNITSTHYKNMTIDGYTIDNNNDANLDKSRIYIPVQYNNNGTATITLPSNDQLGGFSVSSAETKTHSITQDPNKYQLVLKGWINIATGEYYDTSNGPVTATVSQDNLNVFYADWWAADYSYTIPEENLANTVDTNSFVTIKMWDYNELYNIHNSDVWKVDGDQRRYIPRDSIDSEEWYIKGGPYFQFVDNTDSGNCWQYGTLGNTQDRGRYGNNWSNYSYDGILGILGSQGQVPSTGVLESLFPETVTPGSGVNYVGLGNYLFSYNESTKTYSYDSSANFAVYNQSDERFYVSNTDKKYYRGPGYYQSSVGGFFPLNDFEKTLSYNNGTINNWIGLSIDLDFWLPDTPGSSNNANLVTNTATGQKQHMRFEFNGDDDVWVLIDGKLALDIGGIHEAVGGYIDFTTGEIRNAKGNTYRLSDMGIGSGAHALSFYYLEQGGNASNCKITFNIAPRWIEEPVQRGVASVTKTWSADTPEAAKQDLSFSLQTGEGTPVDGTTVSYSDGAVTDDVWKYTWSGLDSRQDYVVVEGADPRFDVSQTSEIIEIKEIWATATYIEEEGFGTSTIILGNGRRSTQGGRLLKGDGSSSTADIDNDIVNSNVGDDVKWTVEGYTEDDQHFYLKNPSGRYLSIRNGRISLVNNPSDASWFYMSPSGDLNDANSDYRLTVNGTTGAIGVGAIVNSADETSTSSPDRIHIYTYYDIYAKTTNYVYDNDYKTRDITVRKEWSDSPDVDHSNDTITIVLYQIAVNSENTVVAEAEYPIAAPNTNTINGSGTITISGLPEAGIHEGQFVTYQYHVTEQSGKAGYISSAAEDPEDPGSWVITNVAPDDKDETTSLDVTKFWKDKDGNNTASNHEGDVITFKLIQKAVGCDYVPVTMRWINNGGGLYGEENFYIQKGQNFVFTVSKPGTPLPHRVRVTTDRGDTDQWNVSASGTHTFTVQNISDAITVSARLEFPNDEWGNGTSWILQTWGHSVPASAYLLNDVDAVVEASKNNTVDSTQEYLYEFRKNQIENGPFTESASDWTASIEDLPLYKKISSGSYHTYYYTISEISVNGEQVHPSGTTTVGATEDFIVSIDQTSADITNTEKEKTTATAIKAWLNADHTTTPPAGASVIFELYADGAATGKTVKLNGKKDVPENPGTSEETIETAGNSAEAYESVPWTAAWSNLQKYTYQEDGTTDHEIVYTIREVPDSIPEGYAADYGTEGGSQPETEVENGGTITNKQLTTSLDILKVDAAGMTTPLEGAMFELRRIDPDNTILSYLDSAAVSPTTTREDHMTGTDGKATFSGLTSGYYEVKETELPPGYVLTGEGKFYIKVENGTVTFVEKGPDGQWHENPGNDIMIFTPVSENASATAKIGNTAGAALPSTGGPGTRLFTIFGSIVILGAGVLLWRRRRLI